MGSISQLGTRPIWDMCAMAQIDLALSCKTQADKNAPKVAPTLQPQESDWSPRLDAILQAGGKCGAEYKVSSKTED